ncbi:hypothetical protein WHR41_08690 [Cladosporium halotolerans]|uniref:Cytochrome b5 heme-binding domain-containing protein n=1 Tax=Cladosporium halotolerans TaxID=1052096 RepID=A0AB34KBP5_9PEZI
MGYWSLAILVISVSFLAYRNPEATRNALPPWLRSKKEERASSEEQAPKPSSTTQEDAKTEKTKDDTPAFSVSEPQESDEGDDSTPKSTAVQTKQDVPTFSLDQEPSNNTVPTPATNSTPTPPTKTNMPPPSKPPTSTLMPPPAPKPSTLMPPPSRPTPLPNRSPAPGLRVPTTGPLPNRGPPANSQQRAGASSSGRGKILLSPGHSPMDWAALSRDPKANLAGVPGLQRVTPSQLKTMTGRKGKPAWSSYMGKVYNITPYLPFHPGGEPELMKAAGRDGGKLFMEVHPWVNWEGMLGSCVVGILVSESEAKSELDDMD